MLAVILFQIFVVESAQRLQHSGLKEIESPVRRDLSGNLFCNCPMFTGARPGRIKNDTRTDSDTRRCNHHYG